MFEYIIVKASHLVHLETKVNESIEEGYEPVGSFVVICYKGYDGDRYAQSMIKSKKGK